jgi:dihydrofolate synthase/folylpolyglutamate synthase
MTYKEAIQYLDSFVNYEQRDGYGYTGSFKLDRMVLLASSLDNPQKDFKCIHVAGTKGKGSTSAIVYSILKDAGYKTGLYTSPHLSSFRERIKINDQPIGEEDVGRLLERIREAANKMKKSPPTFFEVYTMLACLYFKEKMVDFAVFEVGLGGRLDATNILEPLVSAITPVSYEHTDKLGHTLTEIALEKAGIIKDNSICIIAPQEDEAMNAILKICKEKNAKSIIVGKDIKFKELRFDEIKESFKVSGLSGEYPRLELLLLGEHQIVNAATAIGIIEALRFKDISIGKDAVEKGVRGATWPGRLEVVGKNPYIILDGAQNRASAKALARAITRIFTYKKLILVLGVSSDKDIGGILEEILPIANKVVLTKSKVLERAENPEMIKEHINPNDRNVYVTQDTQEALEKAKSFAKSDDLILVTGSLFIVGEIRQIIYE